VKPEVTNIIPSRSSRSGARPLLIVLHTTEGHNRPGVGDLSDLGNFFGDPAREASSHVANDAEGHDARFVPDEDKAWTCAGFNSVSLNIEQIGFAATEKAAWFNEAPRQLANTARWIAYWHDKFEIPIRRGAVSGSNVTHAGVVGHGQLGTVGGGHHDPGDDYPFDYVLDLARVFASKSESVSHAEALSDVNKVRKHFNLKLLKEAKDHE
jgi:N-acetyl-anhydromuramyl-L-alanine amidase AmpD